MNIHIGWWVIPATITLAVIVWGFVPERQTSYGTSIVGAFQIMAGIIVALVAWLIWSLAA